MTAYNPPVEVSPFQMAERYLMLLLHEKLILFHLAE